jgi:hypothetical protein
MLKVEQINMVSMETKITIYLHVTRKKQYISFEKGIFHEYFLLHISLKYD